MYFGHKVMPLYRQVSARTRTRTRTQALTHGGNIFNVLSSLEHDGDTDISTPLEVRGGRRTYTQTHIYRQRQTDTHKLRGTDRQISK